MSEVREAADGRPQGKIAVCQTAAQQMADLFQMSRTNVVEYIRDIYEVGELDEAATCRKCRQVRKEGARAVARCGEEKKVRGGIGGDFLGEIIGKKRRMAGGFS